MKKIKIDHEYFLKIVNLLDRAVGTVEPINRRVYFYSHRDILKAYASDGCLMVNVTLGNVSGLKGFYASPLDSLKLLLKSGEKSDVEIHFGTKLEFLKGSEYLSILHPVANDPRKRGAFTTEIEVKASEIAHVVDIGSIILKEGQETIVGATRGMFFALGEEYGHLSIASMDYSGIPFTAAIPYETARHLVKMLDVIRDEKFKFGHSKDIIGLKFDDGVVTVCKMKIDDEMVNGIERFLPIRKLEGVSIEAKILREGASLCAKFQRKNGGKGYLEFSNQFRIGVLSKYSAYEYIKPVSLGEKVRVNIIPKKLNQFLSRIHEKNVRVVADEIFLIFKGKSELFAIKRN